MTQAEFQDRLNEVICGDTQLARRSAMDRLCADYAQVTVNPFNPDAYLPGKKYGDAQNENPFYSAPVDAAESDDDPPVDLLDAE